MAYRFRFYYLVRETDVIRKIKNKFNTSVSVNGESSVTVNAEGAELVRELERRGFIKIREFKEVQYHERND